MKKILSDPLPVKPFMEWNEAKKLIPMDDLVIGIDMGEIDYHVLDDKIMIKRKDVEKLLNL